MYLHSHWSAWCRVWQQMPDWAKSKVRQCMTRGYVRLVLGVIRRFQRVRDVWGVAAGGVSGDIHWVGLADDGLHVQAALDADLILQLCRILRRLLGVTASDANLFERLGGGDSLGAELFEEELGVRAVIDLAEEVIESDLGL